MNMIPRTIHYCWFGNNPLPKLSEKCISSWKKYCSDFKIVKWNERNFDTNCNKFVKEAYNSNKYAFVADYVRLYVLNNYGGIYMDTDVEVLKPLDVFLKDKAFSGFEDENSIQTGIMGSINHHPFFEELLAYYHNRSFIRKDGSYDLTTNVKIITNICIQKGLIPDNTKQTVSDFTLYPKEFFCPKDYKTGKIKITDNTHAIHHFAGSWL